MKISAINNNQNTQNRQPNFTGLTKIMKRKIYIDGKKDILKIIENRQESQSTIVGQLPKGMFANLSIGKTKEQIVQAINDIMSTFGASAEEIRGYVPSAKASVV